MTPVAEEPGPLGQVLLALAAPLALAWDLVFGDDHLEEELVSLAEAAPASRHVGPAR